MTGWLAAWIELMRRRAPAVVVLALLATAGAVLLVVERFAIDTSTEEMIDPEVPFRRNGADFDRAFPQLDDRAVVVIDAITPEAAEEAAERLAARLAQRADLFRNVEAPAAEPYFLRNGLLFLAPAALQLVSDRLAGAQPLLAALVADRSLRGLADTLAPALADESLGDGADLAEFLRRLAAVAVATAERRPGALSWQAAFGGETAARPQSFVLTQPRRDNESLAPAAAALAEIRRAAAELGVDAANGYRIRLTGAPALDQEELDSVQLGGVAAVAVSFLLDVVLLVVGLASLRLVAGVTLALAIGLIWTTAFAVVAVGPLNLLSIAFAVLFIGLAVDFGIHFALRFREELARGHGPAEALGRAASGVAGGVIVSAVAAAAGFFAFLPTDYRGLAELGLISGVGMAIAVAVNLSVLPALLALAGPRKVSPLRSRAATIAPALARHRGAILGATALAAAAGLVALPWLRFDLNPINLKDRASESVATFLELAADPDTTPYTIDLLAAAREAPALAARLAALPQVSGVRTLASFVPARQDEKLRLIDDMALFLHPLLAETVDAAPPTAEATREAAARLAAALEGAAGGTGPVAAPARELAAALAALDRTEHGLEEFERRVLLHLPRLLDRLRLMLAAGPVTDDMLPPELRARWQAPDGRLRIELRPQPGTADNAGLRAFADAALAVAPQATGTPVIVAEASRAVIGAFVEASLIAAAAIVLLLALVLRRLGDVLLVLTPVALAGLMTAAIAIPAGIALNFANLIALPLLLGLGVASGLHLVLRHREERDGRRLLASSTPRAVLYSELTTVSSFGSLAISGHPGMVSMGVLLTLALGSILVATLLVLPAILASRRS